MNDSSAPPPRTEAQAILARPRLGRGNARAPLSLRWLTTAVVVVSAGLWMLNFWAWPELDTRWLAVRVSHGVATIEETDRDNLPSQDLIGLSWTSLADLPGYDLQYRFAYFDWRPRAGSLSTLGGTATRWYLELPLWIPLAIFTPLSILGWRGHVRRRRGARGRCPQCSYDLTGLSAGSVCPECGA